MACARVVASNHGPRAGQLHGSLGSTGGASAGHVLRCGPRHAGLLPGAGVGAGGAGARAPAAGGGAGGPGGQRSRSIFHRLCLARASGPAGRRPEEGAVTPQHRRAGAAATAAVAAALCEQAARAIVAASSRAPPWRQRPALQLQQAAAAAVRARYREPESACTGDLPDAGAAEAAVQGDLPAPSPPFRTRLEQEVERLVALDVECTTLVCGGRRVQLPVEVCVLDARGATLCHSFCNPCMAEHDGWRHVAGLAPALWLDALPLDALREDLRRLLAGKVVVGHNLGKDLQVLGLADTVPPEALRDTMRYAQLQQAPGRRRRGRRPRRQGRKLSELASEKLGRAIQLERRHDPREDAAAALDLYLSHVHFAAESMDYEDLVEHFAAQILGGGVDGDADGNSRGDSSSGGEEEGSSWAQEWGSMEE